MKISTTILLKLLNSAVIGAACGIVLASVGNVISSSPVAVACAIAGCAMIGIMQRSVVTTIACAFSGALLAAFGSLVGGTTLGVVLTIVASAVLGAIFCYSISITRNTYENIATLKKPAHDLVNTKICAAV